jgi:quinol-cytochrome oxidoreductase complex cytochrome b subunit
MLYNTGHESMKKMFKILENHRKNNHNNNKNWEKKIKINMGPWSTVNNPFLAVLLFLFFSIFYYVFSSFTFPMLYQKSPIPTHSHSPTHPLPLFGPGVPLYWGI